jgi:hypothetical protein
VGAHTPTIVVTIDPGSEPVSGTVQGPDETPAEFVGYIQLIAAFERHHHPESATDKRPIGEAQEPC